jgi:hypothetical protein
VKKPAEPGLFRLPKVALPALPGFGSEKSAAPKTAANPAPSDKQPDGARR